MRGRVDVHLPVRPNFPKELLMTKVRWIAFAALCGGTVFQTATGCDAILAPLVSSLATTVVTSLISSVLLGT
ncbi:MAG TPA: hypothetical protein PLQ89_01520 [Phycisphaerae bacterium]|nr:hypothetical protein [Phycisphaerae bacterium]HOQ84371.1 hypothetical protein [Phycisphaerae bacterium]HPZ97714.1 hypothetical protein [Phycisphaerae bacterium]